MKIKALVLIIVAVVTLSFNVVKRPKSIKTYNPELERAYKAQWSIDTNQFN
ncbi:MAG: hypothetical protein ACO263_01530 [Cyclobacteriaceae bacterium]|jgi:hypothetical protein